MVRYLIRRMNKFGQWQHIDTISSLPPLKTWESYLRTRYGPGRYHIAVAQEGVQGLRSLEGQESIITIGYDHEYMGWWDHRPTGKELFKEYGPGDYFVAKLSDLEPVAAERKNLDQNVVWDILEQGISAMTAGYVVFRLKGVPFE